jgi:hypothetical protein
VQKIYGWCCINAGFSIDLGGGATATGGRPGAFPIGGSGPAAG